MTTAERVDRLEAGVRALIDALRFVMQSDTDSLVLTDEDLREIASAPRATRGRIETAVKARRIAEHYERTSLELRTLAASFATD
jgi:hypothetical protein